MKRVLALILLIASVLPALSQDVLTLKNDEPSANATLGELAWLSGYWKGSGFGGDCDEVWIPASDNAMTGIFRYASEGKIVFSEYMVMEELNGTITLRLKHFGRDLSPWEEKEEWTEFRLVKIHGQKAWFSGLTYERIGDTLIIWLSMKSGDKSWVEEFRFTKAEF